MAKFDIPVRKRKKINIKEMIPIIFFEDKVQHAVWECVLKNEIDTGFWSKVKFDRLRYLSAKTFIQKEKAGISFPPSLMSFWFDNTAFVRDQGYFVAVVMKLAQTYTLDIDEMRMLAQYAEGFIMVDFKDDNSNYRRIQVGYLSPAQRNTNKEYVKHLEETEAYFRNKGIEMTHVVETLKKDPISTKEIRKKLRDISEVTKRKVDISDIMERLRESI